jgi:hypothetical protein
MRLWRNKALLIAGAAALALAIPALGQDTPESLLPPGFGDPEPAPKEEPKAETPADPATPAAEDPANAASPLPSGAREVPIREISDSEEEALTAARPSRPTYTLDVPEALRRPTDMIGPLDPSNWGLGNGAFGTARGAYLASLMRQLEAPLPSRWASMLLRRALMSRVPAPAAVDPVDWVAERAALLLRMGEADAARSLVQSVDVVAYTPLMIQVALDTALATSDPAALCPLIVPGRQLSDASVWGMADAMCAALSGDAARAGEGIDRARARGEATGADLLLAEKLIGAGTDSRRAVTVRWDEVEGLTPWRLGLIGATGAEVPERLVDAAEPRMQAWFARAPMIPAERRMKSAFVAAALGVFSSSALVEMQSLMFEEVEAEEVANTPPGRLRTAFAHQNGEQRIRALRDLWDDGEGPLQRYGRRILTASAATRIRPSAELNEDADDLIASMLSAGLDSEAALWSDVVAEGDADPLAAALLAVGAREAPADASAVVAAFQSADESREDQRTQMLVAGLAGLERIPAEEASALAADLGIRLGGEDRWTRALDAAVRARQPGAVALLAAIGMQAPDWARVPPSHLFRIVRALRLSGLEFEARMIAAEALMRL